MKRRTTIALAALFLAVPALAGAKPNFSGTWTLNASKSSFGPAPAPDRMERRIKHADPSLKMTTTQAGSQGEFTTEISYTTDGTESVNRVRNTDVKSVAKWDGDTLTVDSKRQAQGMEITQHETWTLSKDGKSLTIQNKVGTPQGDFEMTVVLDKQ